MSELPPRRLMPDDPDARVMPVYPALQIVDPVIWEQPGGQQHHADFRPYDYTYHYNLGRYPILSGKLLSYEAPVNLHPSVTQLNHGKNRQVVHALDRLYEYDRDMATKLTISGVKLAINLHDRRDQASARYIAEQFLCRLGYVYGEAEFLRLPKPKQPATATKIVRRLLGR